MKLILSADQAHQHRDLREIHDLVNPRKLAAMAVASDRNMQLLALPLPLFILSTGVFFYVLAAIVLFAGYIAFSYFSTVLRITTTISQDLSKMIPPGARVLAAKVEANKHTVSYDFAFVTKQLELQSLEAKIEEGGYQINLHQDSGMLDCQLAGAFKSWPTVRGAFLQGENQ